MSTQHQAYFKATTQVNTIFITDSRDLSKLENVKEDF